MRNRNQANQVTHPPPSGGILRSNKYVRTDNYPNHFRRCICSIHHDGTAKFYVGHRSNIGSAQCGPANKYRFTGQTP